MSVDLHPAATLAAPSRAERDALQQAAAAAMDRHFPLALTRQRIVAEPLDRDAWRALCAELEPVALMVPQENGGEGLGLEHLIAVAAATGELVLPAPLVPALAAVPLLLAVAPHLLGGVVGGDTVVTSVTAGADTLGERVTAVLPAVAWGVDADVLLLVVPDGDAVRVGVIDARHPSVRAERLATIDATGPRATLHLIDAPVVETGVVSAGEHAAIQNAEMVLAAASAVGAGRRLLALAVGYVGVRTQFGRPVGSFQAVQHRVVDLYGELESAGAAVDRAAHSTDVARNGTGSKTEAHLDALIAMVRAAAAGELVAREGLHLHGGIGFTLEHDAHLYLKRSLADRQLFGGREALLACIAEQLSSTTC